MLQDQTPLAVWLQARDMKQCELAEQLGVSEALVSLVISGVRAASGDFRFRFANTFTYSESIALFGPMNPDAQPAAEPCPEAA